MTEKHVINYNITDAALAELAERHQYVTAHHDYKQAKAAAKECQVLRKGLEDKRVLLKRDALEYGRKVDAEAKRIRLKIEAVEDPIRATINDIDDAEKRKEEKRIMAIQEEIETIRAFGMHLEGAGISALQAAQEKVAAVVLDSSFDEFLAEAEGAKAESESRLRLAISKRQAYEDEQAKLEEQRKAQEAQQKKLDEQQAELDRQAEEQHKQQEEDDRIRRAELDRKAAELKKKQDALDEEERKKKEAKEAEAARVLAEQQAPDVEKLNRLAEVLGTIEMPIMQSITGHAVITRVTSDLLDIINTIEKYAGEME